MTVVFGAGGATWQKYRESGWSDCMLPVVSNPNVEISSASKLKELGKTPSTKDKAGKAIGIRYWTKILVTDEMLDNWARDDDLGISLRCGPIVAFDCDCDDPALSDSIWSAFVEHFGAQPVRRRAGSCRWLSIVRVTEPMAKHRIMLGKSNVLELLGQGQQFIAEGTHPSGNRYVWDRRPVMRELPVVGPAKVTEFLELINSIYGTEDIKKGRKSERVVGAAKKIDDPLADWLRANGYVLSESDGQLNIKCPWEHEHTQGEGSESATSYFSAGSLGQSSPGFSCLHAHCAGRTYEDFLAWACANGYSPSRPADFPAVAQPEKTPEEKAKDKTLRVITSAIDKNGEVKTTLPVLVAALSLPEVCGVEIRYDSFTWGFVYKDADSDQPWAPVTDTVLVRVREHLQRIKRFTPISRDLMSDAVDLIAQNNPVDTMLDFIAETIPAWDGIPRIETSLIDFCGCVDTPYSRACGKYLWTALLGRALTVTGIKTDITLILVGKQGRRKSTFAETIAFDRRFFGNLSLSDGEEKAIRLMRGKCVMEVPELAGMSKRDAAELKRFLTLDSGSLIPKYKEFSVNFPRRCVFVMTTNEYEILSDPTGSRRFAPIEVDMIDIDGLKNVLPQLWAEGRERFLKEGIAFAELERLAVLEHKKYMLSDGWGDAIDAWLETYRGGNNTEPLTSTNILVNAIGVPVSRSASADNRRVSLLMRERGYYQKIAKIGGRSIRVWTKD